MREDKSNRGLALGPEVFLSLLVSLALPRSRRAEAAGPPDVDVDDSSTTPPFWDVPALTGVCFALFDADERVVSTLPSAAFPPSRNEMSSMWGDLKTQSQLLRNAIR